MSRIFTLRCIRRKNTHHTPPLQLCSTQQRDLNFLRRKLFKSIFGDIDTAPQVKTMEEARQRITLLERRVNELEGKLNIQNDDAPDPADLEGGTRIELDARAAALILFMISGCALYGFISLSLDVSVWMDNAKDRLMSAAKI